MSPPAPYIGLAAAVLLPPAGSRADTSDVGLVGDVAVVASPVVVLVAHAVVAVVAFAAVAFHTDSFSAVVDAFVIVGAALISAVVAVVAAVVGNLSYLCCYKYCCFFVVYFVAAVDVAAAVTTDSWTVGHPAGAVVLRSFVTSALHLSIR